MVLKNHKICSIARFFIINVNTFKIPAFSNFSSFGLMGKWICSWTLVTPNDQLWYYSRVTCLRSKPGGKVVNCGPHGKVVDTGENKTIHSNPLISALKKPISRFDMLLSLLYNCMMFDQFISIKSVTWRIVSRQYWPLKNILIGNGMHVFRFFFKFTPYHHQNMELGCYRRYFPDLSGFLNVELVW